MKRLTALYRNRRFRGMVPPALLLILWWQATEREWVSSMVLVPFGQLAQVLQDDQMRHSLMDGLLSTFGRLLTGASIGIAAGLALGIAMGLSRVVERILGPSFHAVRQVAILAWIPLMTAWFGNGDLCKIVFVAVAASKPMVMGTCEGIRSAPPQLVEVGRALCLSRAKMLRHIILPAAAPSIVTAMQLSLIFSWFAAIGAEYVIGAMSGGIGSVVVTAQEHFRTDIVLVGVILISGVGIAMNKVLRKVPQLLFRWNRAD